MSLTERPEAVASWYLCVEAFSVHVVKLKWVLLSIPRLTTWEPETDAILGADTVLLLLLFFFKTLLIYFYREGKGGREGNIDVWVASLTPPAGDLAHNAGMCTD